MNTRVLRVPRLRGNHALAAYGISHDGSAFVVTDAIQNVPFDFAEYSKFKYGQQEAVHRYAGAIAAVAEPHLLAASEYDEPVVVTGTPYKRVPNAAQFLAINSFRQLRKLGTCDVSYASIYQPRLAVGDYGKLSQAERDARNRQKTRAFDPSDFEGKHVVLVDDVRITGSIERSTVAMLADIPTLSITCVNLVRLDPAVALERPTLENELNHSYVKNLHFLRSLMASQGGYAFTTRALKFVLEAPVTELLNLIATTPRPQLIELYQGIVEEGYDQMPAYKNSVGIIANVC